jgi:ABC-type uncharacterized transport system permease subunit
MNLVIAAGILAWALARYPGDLDPFNIVLYLLLLAVGNLLWSLIHVAFLIPTFWLHQVTGLREVLFNLNKYMERPHQIFGGWTQRVLTTVLPFALIVSYPTWMLFHGPDAGMLVNIAVVAVGMFAFVVWFWERGLRAYSSASS